jgi:hypothetical protein
VESKSSFAPFDKGGKGGFFSNKGVTSTGNQLSFAVGAASCRDKPALGIAAGSRSHKPNTLKFFVTQLSEITFNYERRESA